MSFLFLLLLINFASIATSTIINCRYDENYYDVFGTIYQCKVTGDLIINSEETARIENIQGQHDEYMTNDEVIGFVAREKSIEIFPKDVAKFFGNIKLIHISYSHIKELHASDLEAFPNLVELDLHENKIRVLEDGLFQYNPNMKFISFSNNKIVHIDSNVFDGLNNLIYLYLTANRCISRGAYKSSSQVMDVIADVKEFCIDSEYLKFRNSLKNLEIKSKVIRPEVFLEELSKLSDDFEDSEFSNDKTLRRKIEYLKNISGVVDETTSKKTSDLKAISGKSSALITKSDVLLITFLALFTYLK